MKRYTALGVLLALGLCLSTSITSAGPRLKSVDIPWMTWARQSSASPPGVIYKEAKGTRTDTSGVFMFNEALIRPFGSGSRGTIANPPAPLDTLGVFAKLTVYADTSVLSGCTADTMTVVLNQITYDGTPLSSTSDMGSWKAVTLGTFVVTGFATDNATGSVDIPLRLGTMQGVGKGLAGTFAVGTPKPNIVYTDYAEPMIGGKFFAIVQFKAGTWAAARLRLTYYVDDPTFAGN